MRLQHEYVAHIRDGREVGDNAREADLSGIPIINPKHNECSIDRATTSRGMPFAQ